MGLRNGLWKVTGMSNAEFYDTRHEYHAELDMLYENGRVLPIEKLVDAKTRLDINTEYDNTPTALWGDNDPAYDGGNLLILVAKAVLSDRQAYPAAILITQKVLEVRYVSKLELKMPTVEQSAAKKVGKKVGFKPIDLPIPGQH